MRFSLSQVIALIIIFLILFSSDFPIVKKLIELFNQFLKKILK